MDLARLKKKGSKTYTILHKGLEL